MKKILLFFAGLFVLLFTNCSDVDYGNGNPEQSQGNKMSFHLSIPGNTINTYATVDPEGGEELVHTLYVLFFESSTDGSGKFLEAYDISPTGGGSYQSGQTVDLDIPSGSVIDKSKAYNLLFFANPNYYLDSYGGMQQDWKSFFAGKTENEVVQLRIDIRKNDSTEGSADYYTFNPFDQDNLPMSGAVQKEASQELIMAELTRIVCRFDIKNAAGSEYELVYASVGNAFPEQTIWESGNFSDFTLPRIPRLYGIEVENNQVKGGLYAYENFVTQSEQNDAVTTCLILGIRHNGTISYYRVNATQEGNIQQLKRNHVYTFTILNVKGTGEGSEEDAHGSPDSKLNIQVNEWNVDEQGNIVFDGDNILAISTTNIIFDKDGGERSYSVFTAGEGTLIMSNKELPSGFTAELKGNVLNVTATPSEINKSGYVELQFGKLKAIVKISQIGEVDEFLEITPNMVPALSSDNDQETDPIKVNSSGPWTATLYNAQDVFTYGDGGGLGPISGNNDETFTVIANTENTTVQNRYAFVHVTLNSNPQISAVAVITQGGFDGFTISPETSLIRFDADGEQIDDPSDYTFTVSTQDNNSWSTSISGTHKNYFEVERNGDQITVKSKGINPESTSLSAQLRIYLEENPTVYREISIMQEVHTLEVTPTTFAVVPTEGGISELITVNASAPWTATITATGNEAYFNNEKGEITLTGGPGESTFQVTFPLLTQGGVTPQAVVKVQLDGTSIQESLLITQRAVVAKTITLQNSTNLYGYLINNDNSLYRTNYVEQLYQSLINNSWFGPNGTVVCGGVNFVPLFITPNNETDIYVMNSFNGSAGNGSDTRKWLDASSNRVLVLLSDDRTNTTISYLGMTGYTGTGGTGNNVVKTDFPRTINTGDNYTMDTNKLYDYLFRSGPFTAGGEPIQKEDIKLLPYDASNNCLTQWPSTMIPLILDEHDKSRLILGIDPTLRIIYTGEMDLFTNKGVDSINYTENGVTYTGVQNYSYGPHSEANLKFLNNLIAWMFNVVLLGDEFTNQFIGN